MRLFASVRYELALRSRNGLHAGRDRLLWPGLAGCLRGGKPLIVAAIGDSVDGGVHHVGSTAVPGLAAKPIIDILAGVPDLATARRCSGPLHHLSYVHFPHRPEEMLWFCKRSGQRRTHHLHLVPTGSPRYRDELAFRDRLRADRELAAAYASLKRELAREHGADREAYTDAKRDFIERALA